MHYFSALVTAIRSIYGRPKFQEIPVFFLQRFLGAGIIGAAVQNLRARSVLFRKAILLWFKKIKVRFFLVLVGWYKRDLTESQIDRAFWSAQIHATSTNTNHLWERAISSLVFL